MPVDSFILVINLLPWLLLLIYTTKTKLYNNKSMQQKIDEITTMQMLMASNGPLSPEQLIVAALHSLNVQHQLECIDKNNEVC